MSPTLKDVSRLAGVSTATVSRFINGSHQLSEGTALRVQRAIDELGFRPNSLGRSLKTASSKSIGVVIPTLSNPVFAEAVSGITAVASDSDYSIMVTATEYSQDQELKVVNSLLDRQVDGLILTVTNANNSPALDMLEAESVPYVLIYNQATLNNRPVVTIDNVVAGREVAFRLEELGHQHFAMLSGNLHSSDRAAARYQGFVQGLAELGFDAPLIQEIEFSQPNTSAAIRELFADPLQRPTALFCSNDLFAIAAIGALRELGLKVPEDVSVVGFDGITVGSLVQPKLTTVVQPSTEMGAVAAKELINTICGEAPQSPLVLPHKVREGESTGPAGKHEPVALQEPNPTKFFPKETL